MLLRMLGDVRGRLVLDAGCGQGYLSRMLAARGAHVTGVEPTEAMVGYCREREQALRQGVRYVQAELAEYPIPLARATDVHRPLSAYLNEVAALGCRVREVAEPGLDPAVARQATAAEAGVEAYVHLPNFLVVAAERG